MEKYRQKNATKINYRLVVSIRDVAMRLPPNIFLCNLIYADNTESKTPSAIALRYRVKV